MGDTGQPEGSFPQSWLCLRAGSGGPRVKLPSKAGVARFAFSSRRGRLLLPASCCLWLAEMPRTSPQAHLCHASPSLSHGVSCPPVQSSTQEIGEELEDGVIYSISLRKVQLHHTANKGQRWLGVSWGLCQPPAAGCFQTFPCQRRGDLMSGSIPAHALPSSCSPRCSCAGCSFQALPGGRVLIWERRCGSTHQPPACSSEHRGNNLKPHFAKQGNPDLHLDFCNLKPFLGFPKCSSLLS